MAGRRPRGAVGRRRCNSQVRGAGTEWDQEEYVGWLSATLPAGSECECVSPAAQWARRGNAQAVVMKKFKGR